MSALTVIFIVNVKYIVVDYVMVIVVAYLVLFHPLMIMMCWCYWKTIFTPAATSPKQVNRLVTQ